TAIFSESMLDDRTGVHIGGRGFIIEVSDDIDLSGDPDPSTLSGIRFLVFSERPDLDEWIQVKDLKEHPNIIRNANEQPLIIGEGRHGTFTFGSEPLDELFGENILPVRLWFVPITIH